MSGFETLAQVYREIAYPKLKNLRYTGNLVCIYAVVCTGVITLFAGMIIPDSDARASMWITCWAAWRCTWPDRTLLRLLFHIFVVIVGVLILSGAVNTSMIGANGVMNRVAEDGVLLDWFRKPQRRFGTTYRIINLIALLQIATIVAQPRRRLPAGRSVRVRRGLELLPEIPGRAGAALPPPRSGIQASRSTCTSAARRSPSGLIVTTLVLGLVAIANLFSKQIATIYGVGFTAVFFVIFTISERINAQKAGATRSTAWKSSISTCGPISRADSVHARPGCVLVAVRDYNHMAHLQTVLQKTNLRRHDIVVMTVRPVSAGAGEYELSEKQLFSDYEKELLTRVVTMAEKEGKTVDLLVVPGVDPFDAMVQTAQKLKASRLVTGVSPRMDSEELARRIGLAWEKLPEPRHPFSLEIISPGRPSIYVNLGPHPPRLWPEDLDRAHELWLKLHENFGSRLHHRDVIGVALRRLEKDLDDAAPRGSADGSRERAPQVGRAAPKERAAIFNAVGSADRDSVFTVPPRAAVARAPHSPISTYRPLVTRLQLPVETEFDA